MVGVTGGMGVGKRRIGADALILLALLAVLAVLSMRIASQTETPDDAAHPRRSVHSARPGGWKGLYLLLQQQGVRTDLIERAPRDWPAQTAVIITGEPHFTLGLSAGGNSRWDERQVKDALRWVENGGTLIVLSASDNELTDTLKLKVDEYLRTDAKLAPLQPAPFLAGVRSVTFPDTERWEKAPDEAVTLLGDDKPAFVLLRRGKGVILAGATPAIAENRHLATTDNARFLVQMIRLYAGSGGTVAFDEFHQGYQQSDSLWTAIGRPGQLAFWQMLALAALLAYTVGRRFGLPRPMPAAPRVSSEYVASLADLYRRAHARDAALEGVYLPFWRDLCRAAGMALDAPTAEVVPRAAGLAGLGGEERARFEARLAQLLSRCEEKIDAGPKSLTDGELLELTWEMEAMRKELGLGRHDD